MTLHLHINKLSYIYISINLGMYMYSNVSLAEKFPRIKVLGEIKKNSNLYSVCTCMYIHTIILLWIIQYYI